MLGLRELWRHAVKRAARMHPLRQDAWLYFLSGAFAFGVMNLAVTADYREWAEVACAPYLGAALLSEVRCRLAQRRMSIEPAWAERQVARGGPAALDGRKSDPAGMTEARSFRRALVLGLLGLVVVLPLAQQIVWRADAPSSSNRHSAQAQPEVAVIERAGDRFWRFEDPYLAHPKTVGVSPSNDDRSVNASSYFPYLLGMLPFGFANAAGGPKELGDARIELAGFTLGVVALALFLAPVTTRRRVRALQFLIVLPTGALPMVTGGDDMPVLALMFLGLVLLYRRHPVWGGVVMGLAGTLKWTAWPLLLVAALAARDEEERPAILRYGLSVLAIVVPVVGAGAALGVHAFYENAIAFPLGLTKVHSPAASPLLGQQLVLAFPAYKRELTAILVGGALVVVLGALVRRPPRSPADAAAFAGFALAFAIVVAPATRFGYFIYPVNMLVWAYLLHDRRAAVREPAMDQTPQLASST